MCTHITPSDLDLTVKYGIAVPWHDITASSVQDDSIFRYICLMLLIKISESGYRRDSEDQFNDHNVIMTGCISMDAVDYPVVGMDELGNIKIMMPGSKHNFEGDRVLEVPLKHDEYNHMSQDDIYDLVRIKAAETGFS